MGRRVVQVELTAHERATLEMWCRAGKTEKRLAQRAAVILLAAAGNSISAISRETRLSMQNSWKWRDRFGRERLEVLKDKARSGRPPVYTAAERLQVMSLASRQPKDGSNQWSVRKLAAATGLGSTTVHAILQEAALKPHKVEYWCGRSTDPEFEEKQTAILGLYLTPPDNALVLAVDEKSHIQALDRTQPTLPLRSGQPKRLTATYHRHGTTCLLAALSVHEGIIEGRCVDQHRHQEFLSFLKHLYRRYPHRRLHVILDNFSAHKHHKVKEWAARRRRLTLHFTPTYASWLNQVEIWFGIFARDVIKAGVWRSKQQLVDQIMLYITRYNAERAKPFAWTYTGKPLVI
ncbi:MAG TPA: IS630 family transposase [Candidatus Deferrimicrobium sp.]|nr:IS630 family transposase [Candidatus Deferrimicrobium sp.]